MEVEVKFKKIIGSPLELTENSVYFSRNGDGIDLIVTDKDGREAFSLNNTRSTISCFTIGNVTLSSISDTPIECQLPVENGQLALVSDIQKSRERRNGLVRLKAGIDITSKGIALSISQDGVYPTSESTMQQFIGFSQEPCQAGALALVRVFGVETSFTGLSPAARYYYSPATGLSIANTQDSVYVGLALSDGMIKLSL